MNSSEESALTLFRILMLQPEIESCLPYLVLKLCRIFIKNKFDNSGKDRWNLFVFHNMNYQIIDKKLKIIYKTRIEEIGY